MQMMTDVPHDLFSFDPSNLIVQPLVWLAAQSIEPLRAEIPDISLSRFEILSRLFGVLRYHGRKSFCRFVQAVRSPNC